MLNSLSSQLKILWRFKPHGTATPEGRSQERHRRIFLTAGASFIAKAVALLTTFLTIPLTLDYLGLERYGLWMTLSSLIATVAFADLGLGNGLLNAIAEAHGKNDTARAARAISSAFFMLVAVGLIAALLFAVGCSLVDWPGFFNVSSPAARQETVPTLIVLAGCFVLSIPLAVVSYTQLGYQQGFASSIWSMVGSLLGLAGVLAAIQLRAGLPWLVLAVAGAPLVSTAANWLVFFGARRPDLRPALRAATAGEARLLFRRGFLFFLLQVSAAVAFSSDNLVAAAVLGPAAVAEYSVVAKLFSFVPLLLAMLLNPLWPAYGEAIAGGDLAWVRRTLRRSLLVSVGAACLAALILTLFGRLFIRIWVGPEVVPSFGLLAGMGLWVILWSAGTALAMFLNAANILLLQTVLGLIMTAVSIPLKVWLSSRFGIAGIIWGTVIAYGFIALIPLIFSLPRFLAILETRKPLTPAVQG